MSTLLLLLHFGLVLFNILVPWIVVIGYSKSWSLARSLKVRVTHIALMGFVALEAIIGMRCPLTVMEHHFRSGKTQELAFVDDLIRNMMYYKIPPHYFTWAYCIYFALTLFVWWKFPPQRAKDFSQ